MSRPRSLTAAVVVVTGPLVLLNKTCVATIPTTWQIRTNDQAMMRVVADSCMAWVQQPVGLKGDHGTISRTRQGASSGSSVLSCRRRRARTPCSSSSSEVRSLRKSSLVQALAEAGTSRERQQGRGERLQQQLLLEGQIIIGEDERLALAQGDVCKALALLEQQQRLNQPDNKQIAVKTTRITTATIPSPVPSSAAAVGASSGSTLLSPTTSESPVAASDEGGSTETTTTINNNNNDSLNAAHARLIVLLWRAGFEREAMDTFNLARSRAREAAAVAAYSDSGRRTPLKPGAGIPGFSLDLPADVCHAIMRAEFREKDWQGVIEAMRASSVVPRRRGRHYKTVAASLVRESEGVRDEKESMVGDVVWGVAKSESDEGGSGWAPTEETYAIALEACGQVKYEM